MGKNPREGNNVNEEGLDEVEFQICALWWKLGNESLSEEQRAETIRDIKVLARIHELETNNGKL